MANNSSSTNQNGQQAAADQHEHEIEEHEAFEYWGYLFKPDKTGTDKLKGLLRGLKELINTHYEPSENPDLTPSQLASFYRELHGDYNRLFLGTPSESIAFIYKSLGCLYSLQPLPHSTAFTEPTVPALKTEGWIMWQTIQLLLGPEEHSGFLIEAVQKWDVKDPATGEKFPKILPRQCFPMEPDKHMVAWYEGVSERLRREAEEEERQRDMEAEQAEVRRLQYRKREDAPDDESVDSRKSALAYFRDPLYRQDGRPTIVRHNSKVRDSKRPQMSPRRSSMKDKVKESATTAGHVIRNIGSPHLWDGRGKGDNRSKSHDRRQRRSSLPENRYHHNGSDTPSQSRHDSRTSSYNSNHPHHSRNRSGQQPSQQDVNESDQWNADDEDTTPVHSRSESRSRNRRSQQPDDSGDPQTLRHSRSAEPTPSQSQITDYFYNFENASEGRSSHNVTPNGMGPSFAPSASPLFASHIAKQPQPQAPRVPHPQQDYGPARSSRHGPPPPMPPPDRRGYSRSPHPSDRPRPSRDDDRRPRDRHDHHRDDRHYSSRSRDRGGHRSDRSRDRDRDRERDRDRPSGPPPGGYYSDAPTSTPLQAPQPQYPPLGSDQFPPRSAPPYPPPGGSGMPTPMQDRRRSGRMSGSDYDRPPPQGMDDGGHRGSGVPDDARRGSAIGPDDPRRGPPSGGPPNGGKQTRFASVSGVDGRRYPNESGWR